MFREAIAGPSWLLRPPALARTPPVRPAPPPPARLAHRSSRAPLSARAPCPPRLFSRQIRQLHYSAPSHRPTAAPSSASAAPPPPAETYTPADLPRCSPYRPGLLLLSLPSPPPTWPARLELASPLISHLSQHAGLRRKGIGVNVVYDPSASSSGPSPTVSAGTAVFPRDATEEGYPARLVWADGRTFRFSRLGMDQIGSAPSKEWTEAIEYEPNTGLAGSLALPQAAGTSPHSGQMASWEILVCTHGSRDCRCSDKGGRLVAALRKEISRRAAAGEEAGIRVTEIAHVGGHKYAPNALVLPSFDMFSLLPLSPSPDPTWPDEPVAKQLVDFLQYSRPARHPLWAHWRGRAGLREDEQAEFWERVWPLSTAPAASSSGQRGAGAAELRPTPRGPSSLADTRSAHSPTPRRATEEAEPQPQPGTEPASVTLRFKTWSGELKTVPARLGDSLLQVAHAHKLPAMEGTCGGNLECATCHCYLPSIPALADTADTITTAHAQTQARAAPPVPPASEAELDMLGYAIDYRPASRLGCQIRVTRELAEWVGRGGVVGLPRY